MKPDDGYISYIVNPKAGAAAGQVVVNRFEDYLQARGFRVKLERSDSLAHTCELAMNAAVDYNCSLVIAAGGDGTVREVAHGLEGSDKLMLIMPCGTENLLANELGFDKRLATVINAFEADNVRSLDLGSANDKCFTSIIGFGFDGDVVKLVSDRRTGHISHLNYFWPIWRTFWDYSFSTIKVKVDDEEIFEGAGLVFVGNISRYALGLQVLHYADFGDGLLDVCVYKCSSRRRLMKHSAMTVLKKHADRDDVIYRQGKNIFVSSACSDIKTEIDGDPGPDLPMHIKVIPDAVRIMVPAGSKPTGIRTRLLRILK